MATIPIIQLLRNNNIYSTRADARSALEGQKNNVPDGGVILARYSGTTGEQMIIKTLAGFVSNISTPQNATVTIIDVEGASENVQDAITSAIDSLNKGDAAVDGLYVDSVSEDKGIITVTRRPLPFLDRVAFKGEAVTAITQTKGQVSVEFGGINATYVSLNDPHGRFDSDNVDGALNHLVTSLSEAMRSVAMQIGALSASSTVTLESVDETEGFLKVYTIKQGTREVGTINIPKDLVVTSGSVVKGTWDGNTFTEDVSGSGTSTGTALKLVIANQEAPVYINTLDLVKDHTGGNGISISDTNVISVKIDGVSEEFLTVGENGVKLSGVQAAINKANTKVAKDSSADKITLTPSTAADGSVTYTIGQNDIASEAALTAEVNDRQSADTTLQNNIDNVNSTLTTHTADTVVHVTKAEKEKWNTPTDLSNYYTKEEVDEKDAAINSTIESYGQVTSQALNDLGTRLDDYGKVTSQALNDLGTKFGDYYNKQEVDAAIANVDVTSQLANYYTKSETSSSTQINDALELKANKTDVEAEITTREAADNDLKASIDALDAHVSENEDIVSQSLNDLNNRIGENEDIVAQSLNDLNNRIADTYVKSYIDALEARIAELEARFLNMENNGIETGEY